jgi:acetyl-CoA synthetase
VGASQGDMGRREERRWLEAARRLATDEEAPFDLHWETFREVYAGRDPGLGPPPAWVPSARHLRESNLGRLMAELSLANMAELHRFSTSDRAGFWQRVLDRLGVVMERPPTAILDPTGGPTRPRWLPGARLSCVASCGSGDPNALAIVQGSESSPHLLCVTRGELMRLVEACAAGLAGHGLLPGDAVALYLPMTVEAVVAYLAAIRAGLVVVGIADSFAPPEVARRLQVAGVRMVVTAEGLRRSGRVVPLYDQAAAAGAERCVVVPLDPARPGPLRPGDLSWGALLATGGPAPWVVGDPDATIGVLFSSGTTATPKAIPWTHLTPLKCAMDGHFHHDIGPRDVVAWPTSMGWMMGPWLVFASLVNHAAMALFDGAPTGAAFPRFVTGAGVSILGLVPSLVRSWRASGACDGADWGGVRLFSSTGEPSTREDSLWLMSRARYRAPIVEYCGGTEIGGGYVTGSVVQPSSPATFTTPALGLDLVVLDRDGRPVAEGESGEGFLVPPSIGLSQFLLDRDHDEVYYAGCPRGPHGEVLRRHGDQLTRLPGGAFRAQGRVDDAMNLGGIKVSSLELEEVLAAHPAVAECAAVAVQPAGEGAESLVVFATLRAPVETAALGAELKALLATRLNPLFRLHDLVVVDHLPRTASGKLMRRELRDRHGGAPAPADEPGRKPE